MSNVSKQSEDKPTKWWQWILLYPALAIAIIGAIPTYGELYRSSRLGVDFGDSQKATEQSELWQRNLECAAAPFDYLQTSSNVLVDATICRSGDVFVRVKTPEDRQFYEWVPLERFFRRVASLNFITSAYANDSVSGGNLAQNTVTVICQRWLDNVMLLRRIAVLGQGCFDETVNTYNGMVVSQRPAPCDPNC